MSRGTMMRSQCPVFDGDQAADRLTELGLKAEILGFALKGADAEARTYTELDPPNMQGMARYSRTVRLLREQLVPLGWSFDNPRNLARTVSPDRRVAIIATLGDAATGIAHVMPSTRYGKGVADVQPPDVDPQPAGLGAQAARSNSRRPVRGDRGQCPEPVGVRERPADAQFGRPAPPRRGLGHAGRVPAGRRRRRDPGRRHQLPREQQANRGA